MAAQNTAVCACGAVMTARSTRCLRCHWRLASARYRASAHGKHITTACNARRIWIGRTYRGRAQSTEQIAVIRNYVKERTSEFVTRFPTGA